MIIMETDLSLDLIHIDSIENTNKITTNLIIHIPVLIKVLMLEQVNHMNMHQLLLEHILDLQLQEEAMEKQLDPHSILMAGEQLMLILEFLNLTLLDQFLKLMVGVKHMPPML